MKYLAPTAASLLPLTVLLLLATACSEDAGKSGKKPTDDAPKPDAAAMKLIKAVPQTETWSLPGLTRPVHVVRTEGNVAHIYAADRFDLARAHGFVAARDRFFLMDMMRRLGQGTVAEVFGTAGLSSDIQSRATGMATVGERVCAKISEPMGKVLDAYTEGVNAYIEQVKAGKLPPPSELKLAAPLLGYKKPWDAMKPFSRKDTCGAVAVVLFQQGYETEDITRAARLAALADVVKGKPKAQLRLAGLRDDVIGHQAPLYKLSTTPGYGLNGDKATGKTTGKADDPLGNGGIPSTTRAQQPQRLPNISAARLSGLAATLSRFSSRLGKAQHRGFGSNIWTVAGTHTKDGAALLASDGHLQLSVPSLFWQIGLDTAVFGGGDTHQLGLTFAGIPMMAAGTNGELAWSNTYLYGDITDYYAEVITLDAAGRPKSSRHGGADKPISAIEETYNTAKIALLGSEGGPVKITRYVLWDGRPLVEIEGRKPTEEELADPSKLPKGQALINLVGSPVVPMDMDKDGVITGISMDLTTLDVGDTPSFVRRIGHSKTVQEARAAQKGLVGWAQNTMYADSKGSIAYSGYNPTPCRSYLPRENNAFKAGADPQALLDGTTYRGFSVVLRDDGAADEDRKDPYECVIPFDQWPQAENPKEGYIVNANNDFGATTLDGKLGDDKWYVGGPFVLGLRAKQIDDSVKAQAQGKSADIAGMQATQALHKSLFGCRIVPMVRKAVDALGPAAQVTKTWLEAADRLDAWAKAGCPAESGVQTFYHEPTAEERQHAVATMLFNALFAELQWGIWHDEGIHLDSVDVMRGTIRLLEGRGKGNPNQLASFDTATGQSVLLDDAGTPEVESGDDIITAALGRAVVRLSDKDNFGDAPMDGWLWGLKHLVKLEWLLASFLEDQPSLASIAALFSITPDVIPLMEKLPAKDPRIGLTGFPRPGDYGAPDASAPNAIRGYNGTGLNWNFTYSHGPVMRMVIALGPNDGFAGQNIIPGGQSSLTDSKFFADQVKLWLGNKTWTMHLRADAVAKHAKGRELLQPAN